MSSNKSRSISPRTSSSREHSTESSRISRRHRTFSSMPFSEFPQHTKQPRSEVSFSAYPISPSPTQAQDRQQCRSLALTPPYQSRSCRIYRIHRSVHPRLHPRAWHEQPWPFPRQRFRRLIPPRASPLEWTKTSPYWLPARLQPPWKSPNPVYPRPLSSQRPPPPKTFSFYVGCKKSFK